MLQLLRSHRPLFILFAGVGVALRLWFIFHYPAILSDSLIYGDIAKNWMQHGVFGLSAAGGPQPTYIRLPGYPAFLALLFKPFGLEHYNPALFVQIAVDLGTCIVIAALARKIAVSALPNTQQSEARTANRVSIIAFALTALCPFLANYAAAALTESWSIFLTALGMYCAWNGIEALRTNTNSGSSKWWWACGAALTLALMLRPDNGILLAVIVASVLREAFRSRNLWSAMVAAVPLLVMVLAFIVPWTIRNWRTMHRFQPLAPRYANDPGEFVPLGFNRWIKTWIVDFISVQNVYWHVDGEPIPLEQVPRRAFGAGEEARRTQELLDRYNDSVAMDSELDGAFGELAEQRIREHPLQYYVGIPLLRIADMWLRPRNENLPIELDWWNYEDHEGETQIAVSMALLNLTFVIGAAFGFWRSWRSGASDLIWLMAVFVLARSLFLGTLENPEPRYTLECYPVVLASAAVGFNWLGMQAKALAGRLLQW